MYLKNIEVQGFKSFAQKINFEFHNGITGNPYSVNVIPHDLHSDPCFFRWRLWNSCPEAVRKDPDLP